MFNFTRYSTLVFSEKGADINCYGLAIVKHRMQSLGKQYNQSNYEAILHSSYWPDQILDLLRWKALHKPSVPLLVGGNSPSTNPAPYLAMDCFVHLGDGELYHDDCEFVISPKNSEPHPIACTEHVYPFAGYVDEQKEGKTSRRYFCEISRGCRNKCLFCQYSWLKPYREAPVQDVYAALEYASTKHVRVFAADRFQHSGYKLIRRCLEQQGIVDTGSDVSLKFLNRNRSYLKYTRKIRTGIEGMSYRLRKMVGKNITDQEIVDAHSAAVEDNIRCFDWYMIYGLPTEGDDDAEEFVELLAKLEPAMKGRTLAIHWNAFQPNPCTPLQWAKPALKYPRKRLDRIHAARFAYTITHKPLYTKDSTLARRVLTIRAAGAETLDMLKVLAFRPSAANDVDALSAAYKKRMGVDLWDEWPADKEFPWDRHVQYNREKMRLLYDKRITQHCSN